MFGDNNGNQCCVVNECGVVESEFIKGGKCMKKPNNVMPFVFDLTQNKTCRVDRFKLGCNCTLLWISEKTLIVIEGYLKIIGIDLLKIPKAIKIIATQ